MIVQCGVNGCVYAYNYSFDAIGSDEGEPGRDGKEWFHSDDMSVHGHYAYATLFEGNVAQYAGVGDYWGPAGPRAERGAHAVGSSTYVDVRWPQQSRVMTPRPDSSQVVLERTGLRPAKSQTDADAAPLLENVDIPECSAFLLNRVAALSSLERTTSFTKVLDAVSTVRYTPGVGSHVANRWRMRQ